MRHYLDISLTILFYTIQQMFSVKYKKKSSVFSSLQTLFHVKLVEVKSIERNHDSSWTKWAHEDYEIYFELPTLHSNFTPEFTRGRTPKLQMKNSASVMEWKVENDVKNLLYRGWMTRTQKISFDEISNGNVSDLIQT